jgi:penicillin amidase
LSLIGDDIYTTFTRIPEFAESSLIKVLSNKKSSWLDDINTVDYKETLSDVILNSVDGAIREITRKYGTTNLKWGYVAKRQYNHILGSGRIENLLHNLNLGPFPAEGSNSNLNTNEFDYSQNFRQISGSALRKIYDLSDANLSYSIMPTGQSGLPKSLHYSDQVELYASKSFRVVDFSEESIRSSNKYKKLTLLPL